MDYSVSRPTPEEYSPTDEFFDRDFAYYDIEHSECVLVQEATTGLISCVFGQPDNGYCMLVVTHTDQLNAILGIVARVKGRHTYSGRWAKTESEAFALSGAGNAALDRARFLSAIERVTP